MSGIYGFAAQKGISDPAAMLGKMLGAIQSPEPAIKHQWATEKGYAGLGAVHPARIGESGHFANDPSTGAFCVFDGVVYRDAGTRGENPVEPNGAALLLERYLESGTKYLSQVSGSFNVAWWDEKARRLVLANDKLGQRLLFFGYRNGTLVFASLLARVMATGLMSSEIDVEAFADLISYKHTIGERTLFKDTKILPPASVLTYEAGQVDIKQYWHIGQIEPYGKYDKQRLDELEELFRIAVRRSIRSDITVAIDLTGGLSSRCILAAAANMQLPFVTHTGGQPDSTDVVFAQQEAAMAGAEHIFEPIGPGRLAEWLVPMVRYQGGITSTLRSHICQHFDMPLPFDASVQGIGIKNLRNRWVSQAGLAINTLPAVQSLLKRRMSSNTAKRLDLGKLWRAKHRTVGLQAPVAHLESLVDQYKNRDRPEAVLDCVSLHEWCRKLANRTALIIRASQEVYYPCLDHEFVVALAHIPTSERMTSALRVDLIKRFFPQLLDVRLTTTLLPVSLSPIQARMTRGWRAARRRILRLAELSNNVPVRTPNYHYSQWIRNEMRPTLVGLLYNPNAAFRAYLRWETVKALLDQHFSGKEDWEHLVAALTVFEIAHSLWVAP